jgi:hypothetical protein
MQPRTNEVLELLMLCLIGLEVEMAVSGLKSMLWPRLW